MASKPNLQTTSSVVLKRMISLDHKPLFDLTKQCTDEKMTSFTRCYIYCLINNVNFNGMIQYDVDYCRFRYVTNWSFR